MGMIDREKVINDLLEIRKDYEDMRCKVSVQIINDAIELLKEQQKLIDEITQRRMDNGAFD